MRNAAFTALVTSLLLALVGISLAVSEHAQTRARLDQRLALQADGEANALGGLFARTRLALRLLAGDSAFREGIPRAARGCAERYERGARRARAGRAPASSARRRPSASTAASARASCAARPHPRPRSHATSATRVLPRDARHAAGRGARVAAVPLGGHGPVGRLQLDARARRRRSAARHRALRAPARQRARGGHAPRWAGEERARWRSSTAQRPRDLRHDARHRSRGSAAARSAYRDSADRRDRRRRLSGEAPACLPHASPACPPASAGSWSRSARSRRCSRRRASRRRARALLAFSLALAVAGLIPLRQRRRDEAACAERGRGRARGGRAPLAHRRAHRPLQPPSRGRCDHGRAGSLRPHGVPPSVLMLDLDNFKRINDGLRPRRRAIAC